MSEQARLIWNIGHTMFLFVKAVILYSTLDFRRV